MLHDRKLHDSIVVQFSSAVELGFPVCPNVWLLTDLDCGNVNEGRGGRGFARLPPRIGSSLLSLYHGTSLLIGQSPFGPS